MCGALPGEGAMARAASSILHACACVRAPVLVMNSFTVIPV